MGLETAEAILLDVTELHDQDRIVTWLGAEQGKRSGVAKGARRKYSRFAGQLQPLAKVRITWYAKEGRDLARVSAVDLVRPADRIQRGLDDLLLGSYLRDHVLEFAQEGEESAKLYRLLDSTIEALLAGVPRDLAARFFEIWVLRLQGIFPAPAHCPICGRALGSTGAVLVEAEEMLVCPDCGAGPSVDAELLGFLRRTGREGLTQLAANPPSPAVLRGAERLAARVRRHFLQHELRSYEVLARIAEGS
jgi:DNA repair protein RecO (recombination protein O)